MPLTSSEKKDYILRLIEQIRQMMDAMLGKVREGNVPDELLARARESIALLLGPLAGVAPRMDSATAGQMVGDPDVLAAWAEVTAAESAAHRQRGDEPSARATARRALELALEAHLRTNADVAGLLALIARLRPEVDAATLAPRHAQALAALP
jgi:hypothetical protein